MKNNAPGGMRPTLCLQLALVVLPAIACATSSGRRPDPADATTQEVREDSDEIPCEPRRVLQTICQQCHSAPTKNGAPFSLVRRSDVLVVRLDMIAQLEAKRMPLTPVTIADEDRQALLGWLTNGAPAVSPRRCELSDAGDDAESSDGSAPTDACTDAHDADTGATSDGGADAFGSSDAAGE